ncbi:hypothetical protein VC279_06400 [Xanthomonas sp. WHRI 10064A]|uniref:hypothetical protein n=1 Tax=unclassified Xanthomonas TaxID=2643310 RepID=UPI002B22B725|nr:MULTISPECIES: hypothetical protein [unclassified Xanthomonas]MEA9585942.1 hypothetical protein [Xanthomonas sp. WHRI 10064B]MEA9614369.1 hypothetical protein [Xanthomonas sp. WHRI 10064A]
MSRNSSFAVVLEGGLVQAILVQDWPEHRPLPLFAVVDYDTEGAADHEITRFPIGNTEAEAICRSETPTVHEQLADSLSPRAVLTALDESVAPPSSRAKRIDCSPASATPPIAGNCNAVSPGI